MSKVCKSEQKHETLTNGIKKSYLRKKEVNKFDEQFIGK